MLGWLCIVQSLWAYTPGVRAGAECGAAALTPAWGYAPNPTLKLYSFLIACKIITLFLLFVIRVFAVGIFVLDEDFLYIFKLVLLLFPFFI